MKVEHYIEETNGFFKAVENGKEAGMITYSKAGTDKIIIAHTEVNDEFRGRSVGKIMVMAAVEYARENSIKIIPLCPFAKSVFDKTEEIRDILA